MDYSASSVVQYILQSLYDGKQSDQSGYYCFSRKELAENAGIALSTLNRCKDEVIHYFATWCDLASWAKYQEFKGVQLYQDVTYEKGTLKFRRNPLTIHSDLSYLWGLPPLNATFSFDAFDEKHRRRLNGNQMKYDAIPWSWNADEHEEELNQARAAILEHQSRGTVSESY